MNEEEFWKKSLLYRFSIHATAYAIVYIVLGGLIGTFFFVTINFVGTFIEGSRHLSFFEAFLGGVLTVFLKQLTLLFWPKKEDRN